MSYGTQDNIKSVSYLIRDLVDAGKISDQELLDVGDVHAQPVIDAAVNGGAALSAPSNLIVLIWSLLTAAQVFRDRLSHKDQDGGYAEALEKRAIDLLDKVKSGELTTAGVSSSALVLMADPTADRPATEVFVGDETTWEMRSEVRE